MRIARSNFVSSIAAGVIFAAAARGANAEQSFADSAERLPPYWVEAEPLPSDHANDRPYVLTQQAFSGRSIVTLKDLLAHAPGVLLQESFGGFEPPRLSIRGSGLQSALSSRGVVFLADGFPLTLTDGSFNSALIDPSVFSRVELFRGDASAALAPSVIGGAFDLCRGGGLDQTATHAEAGSFGRFSASAAARTFSEQQMLDGAASFARQDGFRDHSAQHRAVFSASGRRSAASDADISVSVYVARAAYDVPGPLTLTAARTSPEQTSTEVERDHPRREASLSQVSTQFAQENSVLRVTGGVSWLHNTDHFRQLRPNGLTESQSDDVTLAGTLSRLFETDAGDHLLNLRAGLSRGWRDSQRRRNDSGGTGDLFGDDGLFAATASTRLDANLHLSETVMVTGGVGLVWANREIADRFVTRDSDARTTLELHSTAWTPLGRLTWTTKPGLTFHASIARAVEPPTFDDLIFVDGTYPNLYRRSQRLANQRATTCEFGTSQSRGPLRWDITLYTADWRNEILRLADASGLPRGAVNAGSTRHRGVELLAQWTMLNHEHRLSGIVTVAWNQFTFVDDPVYGSNRLAGAPPSQGSASLLYQHPRGGFVAASADWLAGATPVDHAGRLRYPGYTLCNLRAGWRSQKHWTAFAEVRNLFNREHIASTAGVLDLSRNPAATAVFLPGVRRSFAIGLEWNR